MPNAAPLQSNFQTGEISPLLYGRVDNERFKSALAKCLNYLPTAQGGLVRRPGGYYVSPVVDSSKASRLMPFEFSTTQAYMLEFGDLAIRFYRNNAPILETTVAITGATAANPVVITATAHGYANGDHVELASIAGMTQLNGRRFKVSNKSANTFELQDLAGTNINGIDYTAYASGGTTARVYGVKPSRAITGATAAAPVVITSTAHGFSNGEDVYIKNVAGMTALNGRTFQATNVTANTFELWDTRVSVVDGSAYAAYTSGGTASSSPYAATELFQLKFTQSADTLYITHPAHAPRKLTRSGHTNWTLSVIDHLDGPYLDNQQLNDGTRDLDGTVTPSGTAGSVTLTATNVTPFSSTDLGRLVRLKHGSTWGYAVITLFTSTSVVTAQVINAFGNATATSSWKLGAWSTTTGFPGATVFHEDRLFFSGPSSFPQRFDGSVVGDYENFAPSSVGDVISATHAFNFSLNANDVNVVRWMTTDEKGLLQGTTGGEWVIKATSQADTISAITPPSVKRASSYGSADVQPVQVGRATMYIQRATKKLRELTFFYDVDGFQANDMTLLAEHVTGPGITQLAYQKEPQSVIWAVRSDGVLCGLTYERDIEKVNAGWSRHVMGGYGSAASDGARVESVAAIPSTDGTREELWLIVKRYINGQTVRQIEYLTPIFNDLIEQQDAFFVDAGLTYDNPLVVTNATAANPVVVTSTAHGLSNGDTVRISGVSGMTQLNGETFTVAGVAANTFQLSGVNGLAYTSYVSGGEVRKEVTTVSGLWHLVGQTVVILADGAVLPSAVVSALGEVTLSVKSTVVQVGLGYTSDGQLPRLDAGSANGTSIGKTRRTHRVGFMLHRTLGLKIGTDFDDLDEVTFRTSSDAMSRAPALFSGVLSETLQSDYDFENQICWRQDTPLPGLILAIAPQMVTQDRQ